MSATPRAMPDDLARLCVLEATIEILKTENEILKRRLASAETWAAQAVITERLDALAAERARPWWRLLVHPPCPGSLSAVAGPKRGPQADLARSTR